MHHIQDNPMEYIETPKVPDKVLPTVTPEQVKVLIENARCTRDRAIFSLFADSGARRSEVCNIRVPDVDLPNCKIKVVGKGDKEGFLIFGAKTQSFLTQHIAENSPVGLLFDLIFEDVKSMLNRLREDRYQSAPP